MKNLFDRLTDHILALLGLDFEVDLSTRGDRMNAITSSIYLGSRPTPEDLDTLRDVGISHTISCLEGTRRADIRFLDAHFEALFIDIRDVIGQDISAVFPTFHDFVSDARGTDPHAKILVHCERGVSRSAALVIAELMTREQRPLWDVFLEVRSKRPQVLPNIAFASWLQQLEHELLGRAAHGSGPTSLTRYLREVCDVPAERDLIESALERHSYNAPEALRAIFGGDIPRVVQGVRV